MKKGLSTGSIIFAFCVLLIFFLIALAFFLNNRINLSPQEETQTHGECINNTCVAVQGLGVSQCSPSGSFCGCADTDVTSDFRVGVNFFQPGVARNSTTSRTDRCSVNGRVIEYSCGSEGNIDSYEIACESLGNYTCHSGACYPDAQEFEDCQDSDGGTDYFNFGRATNGKVRISDYCTGEGQLAEVYCSENTEEILIDLVDCDSRGSFICSSGACVPS